MQRLVEDGVGVIGCIERVLEWDGWMGGRGGGLGWVGGEGMAGWGMESAVGCELWGSRGLGAKGEGEGEGSRALRQDLGTVGRGGVSEDTRAADFENVAMNLI
jgi:hypothetical protein